MSCERFSNNICKYSSCLVNLHEILSWGDSEKVWGGGDGEAAHENLNEREEEEVIEPGAGVDEVDENAEGGWNEEDHQGNEEATEGYNQLLQQQQHPAP